ncbi:MAG: glycoside hydrolase family 15 protein [Gaiella sp.]
MNSPPPTQPYLPIADHGVIGDLHTVALVGITGTVDWLCLPRFDSPSVFGAILDSAKGGHFAIAPAEGEITVRQLYLPETNVLVTRFLTEAGVGEIEDFMPVDERPEGEHRQRLIRRVHVVRGTLSFDVEIAPAFDYGRATHTIELHENGATFASEELRLVLESEAQFEVVGAAARASLTLHAGESATFLLRPADEGDLPRPVSEQRTADALASTISYWRRWIGTCTYRGRWREMVQRSALTLKLLTYQPTGAIVAAPTTSLPEVMGGHRNWDYRYTWIRDAAFTVFAFLRLGFTEEAAAFMGWLTDRFAKDEQESGPTGPLQIMYGIDGRKELEEIELDHLEGYRGSSPVRVGNGAADQLQLDIYGELIDSVYLFNKYGEPIYHHDWQNLVRMVDWLCENWDRPDEGIWETRGGQQHFTYSRLMSWVALERAIRIARQRGLPGDLVRWLGVRDTIYAQIMKRGWHPERKAFTQHYDTNVLDASLLLMPLTKFVSPTDPRWLSTLDAIGEELVSDSLVHRYNAEASPDGLGGQEGTFSICSFWYVEALARAGRLEEARIVFEKMLTYSNHVGLYSEEIGPTGEQLGNFPQAFTHLALISAATTLDHLLG